jgi:methylamine dehydrogenase heavy chain
MWGLLIRRAQDANHVRKITCLVLISLLGFPVTALAEVPSEAEFLGSVADLPVPFSPYWIWASDAMLGKMALLDLLSGEKLGEVDGGLYISTGLFPANDREFYVPETHYSLGTRGERHDIVTFYDTRTLAVTGEVFLPTQRAQNSLPVGNSAISDDGRFVAVYNFTPAQSLGIVDTLARSFVGDIPTPGCALVYAAGPRRFFSLCANGSLLLITLDDDGAAVGVERSEPFFDPVADPITEKGIRVGNTWYFVSFEGYMYAFDASGIRPRFSEPWSLLSDGERAGGWRVGGRQFLAIDAQSGRAFVLLHRGGVDTHKTGGTHMGVYNLNEQSEIERVALESPGFTFSGQPVEFGTDWMWPFNRLYGFIARQAMEYEVHARPDALLVTGGERPLLVVAGEFTGSLAVYDAQTLEFMHRVSTSNWTTLAIQDPRWGDSGGGSGSD